MTVATGTELETVRHGPATAGSAIIWLHGLGADAHDFEPLMPMLGLPETRFIFPNAPVRPVTINGGMQMRAWYDFLSMDFASSEEPEHIQSSVSAVQGLMDEQMDAGLPSERLVMAGFSQGGVIALQAALTYDKPVAGVLALSTYLPQRFIRDSWPQSPNVLQCHGSHDPVIPLALGRKTSQSLQHAGVAVDFREYPMAHQVIDTEIQYIAQTLQRWL